MLEMSILYKVGDGECHLSNCFPVPGFFRHRQDGAGHWFVAHREHMEQRNRNIRRTKKKTNRLDHSTGSGFATPATGNTLDGSLLIRLHCVENPSDLCSIDISEQRLTSVKNEDFKEFDNIVYINASDNSLSIESFRSFCLLRELDLSLNGCCDMRFHPEDFPHLEVLDLSFNNVSEADIVCIGHLVGLKVLCLTGNRLHQLPANMASSNHPPTLKRTNEEKPLFGALEVLTLDDNQLSSDVFHSLSNFTRLQHLNLQGNNISEIPFMLPNGDVGHIGEVESSLPLPQLQFLSLAHNKIAEEEALLAAALFPSLTELVIHNNPLTTQRTGDPPLLTYLLSMRRGVNVKRIDQPEVGKPSVMLPDSFKHKVRNEGTFLKRPWLTERRHDSLQERESQDVPKDPSCSQAKEREKNDMRDGVIDRLDETKHQAETFFVTQPEDLRDKEFKGDATANAKKIGEKRISVAVSETFKDIQDILMDVNSRTADVVEATGIQTAVRMVEQTLVCSDVKSKPPNHRRQPHTSTEKRNNILFFLNITLFVTPLKSKKMQGEKAESNNSNNTVRKIPLSSVSDGQPVNKQVDKEEVSLLMGMCGNYNTVHAKTVEATTCIEQE
ncbi:unnamed protein product [Lota lota]